MKKIILSIILVGTLVASCYKEREREEVPKIDRTEVRDFIWKGMNKYYLWQSNVPDLADDRFKNGTEYAQYLARFTSPREFFNQLMYHDSDFYSNITSDYSEWEESFQGKIFSSGMDFSVFRHHNREFYVIVNYVLPNSSADLAGIKRGDIFSKVDGVRITNTNSSELLFNNKTTMSINVCRMEGARGRENINEIRENVLLNKSDITENPILVKKVLNVGTKKVAYLMFNNFLNSFDDEVNAAFGEFKAQGVTDLVLDLRYNTGGSVSSAIRMASMITGQFNGELFSREVWNEKIQPEVERSKGLDNFFVDKYKNLQGNEVAINSLNLSKLYVITTGVTASASELLINSLRPYIEVIQIGSTTRGKDQAAIEVYDEDANGVRNPNHKWAMLPMAVKHNNRDGNGEYSFGLDADESAQEYYGNMGILGEPTEAMLAKVIEQISETGKRFSQKDKTPNHEVILHSSENNIARNRMYMR